MVYIVKNVYVWVSPEDWKILLKSNLWNVKKTIKGKDCDIFIELECVSIDEEQREVIENFIKHGTISDNFKKELEQALFLLEADKSIQDISFVKKEN